MISEILADPLDKTPIGDVAWLKSITGWSHDKIARLCRMREIPGAFKALPKQKGCTWNFRKAKTLSWLERLEAK